MKRTIDVISSALGLLILLPVFVMVALLIKLTSKGPVLYWSERIGHHSKLFYMPKFRTMRCDTPKLPSAHLEDPQQYLIPVGGFLRKTSLDELPQLLPILKGDMSVVGPRPVIRTERKLLKVRREKKVDQIRPGLTGWAQVNGRDHLSIEEKVSYDAYYVAHQSLWFDVKIILRTAKKVFMGFSRDTLKTGLLF